MSAVTLAVAALPEEFPIAYTVFLGVGVFRLARRKALVRRAVSVENIGRVSCICSDKSGTLTEGRLRVVQLVPTTASTSEALLLVALCASRPQTGDPLDEAIFDEAAKRSLAAADVETLATLPFTEERRRESRVFRARDGEVRLAMKGAPEVVFARCALTPVEVERWLARVDELAATGAKVIACATGPSAGEGDDVDGTLTLVGLIAFTDPLRGGVVDALAWCTGVGIRVVMVTGDHQAAARSVAAQLGLGPRGSPRVITGEALEARLAGGDVHLADVDVVARAFPAQKLDLVRALQRGGEIVAVTGDGVNDVPAI